MRITLFDNHDSFTWNLAHDLGRFGWTVNVVREGAWTADHWGQTDALVLSPGPGLPEEHAQLMDVTAEALRRGVPTLGVCLGMQALAVHAGGTLRNLEAPLHGRRSTMTVDAEAVKCGPLGSMWEGLGPSMEIAHYHSWVVEEKSLSAGWHVNAPAVRVFPWPWATNPFPLRASNFIRSLS